MPAFSPRRSRRNTESPVSSLAMHNVVVGGRRTSVRLESVMWEALRDIARRRDVTIHDLVTDIDRRRSESSLTAAIRVYIVNFYRAAATLSAQPQSPPPPRLRM